MRAAVVGAAATISVLDTPRIVAQIVEDAAGEMRTNQLAASVWVAGDNAMAPVAAQAEEAASASIQYIAAADRQASQLDASVTVAVNSANAYVETAHARNPYTEEEISCFWRHGTRRELVDAGLISEWYPPPKENWFGEDAYDELSEC